MKNCPCCDARMDDTQSLCPVCGADYLESVIGDMSSADSDASMQLTALEEGLRPLDDAAFPSLTDTARRLSPQLWGGAALFCLVSAVATGANIFWLLAIAAAVPAVLGLAARLCGRSALSPGEAVVEAAARIFDEDAARLQERYGERPEVVERLSAMRSRIDEAIARQTEARLRNTRTIRIAAAVLLGVALLGVGALALRNHAARKAAAEYAAQPEWVKLRDAYLASDADEFADNASRLAVLHAMLDAGEPAAAEEFFFTRCQGAVGDFDCALLIAKHYRDTPEVLAAFADRVSLRYDSDTRKIKNLKR